MEIKITFCDRCNEGNIRVVGGRGVIYCSQEAAIGEFDWIETDDGEIICTDCQDEAEPRLPFPGEDANEKGG